MKQHEEYKIVGKSVPRRDSIGKVTGQAIYTNDIKLPRMLYAKVLRSPSSSCQKFLT